MDGKLMGIVTPLMRCTTTCLLLVAAAAAAADSSAVASSAGRLCADGLSATDGEIHCRGTPRLSARGYCPTYTTR